VPLLGGKVGQRALVLRVVKEQGKVGEAVEELVLTACLSIFLAITFKDNSESKTKGIKEPRGRKKESQSSKERRRKKKKKKKKKKSQDEAIVPAPFFCLFPFRLR